MAFISSIKEQEVSRDLLPPASEIDKTEALGALKAFGFIRERVTRLLYNIYRLVHAIIQNRLKLKDEWET